MKILHVITSLRTGGAEKLMVDLLPRLKAKGLDVELLLFDGTGTPFRRSAEAAGIKVHDLGTGGSVYSPMRLFKLIPYLRKYDVVHTPQHRTSAICCHRQRVMLGGTLYHRAYHLQPPSRLEVVFGRRPLDVRPLPQGNLHLVQGRG